MNNTLTSLTVENKKFYDRNLLERTLANLTLYEDAQKRQLPTKQGTEVSFRKYESLKVPGSSLTEGTTPQGSDLKITEVIAKVKQEGDFVMLSDMLELAGIDNNVVEATDLLGEQAALTADTRIRDVITKGTNVIYAGGKESRSAITEGDVLTAELVKKAAKTLKNANIKKFEDGYYHAVIDPDQEYDLKKDPEWIDVAKYAATTRLLDGEIGKLDGVRFKTSTNVEIVSDTAKVHLGLIYGKDTYGCVNLEKGAGKPEVIVKNAGSAGTADPLNQRSTVGWKACYTACIINQEGIVRVETAASK